MQVIVDNSVRLKVTPEVRERHGEFLKAITRDLTIVNPDYVNAVRHGRSIRHVRKHLLLYNYNKRTGNLVTPRGYLQALVAHLIEHKVPHVLEDRTLLLPPVAFGSRIVLRDYQRPAVAATESWEYGVLEAPCGSGKTVIGLQVVADKCQPALWITHTKDLARQVTGQAEALFAEVGEIGLIGNGEYRLGPKLTVGLVQTLVKADLGELADRFGLVIVDEAHHVPADTFRKIVNRFPGRYRYGLTATPERADGLHPVMYAVVGPKIHAVDQIEVRQAGCTVIPLLRVVPTGFTWDFADRNYNRLIAGLSHHLERNRLIVEQVVGEARAGRSCLVLANLVSHVKALARAIETAGPGLAVKVLTGSVSARKRDQILAKFRAGEVAVLVATANLAKEGLDLPNLERLFLASPNRDANDTRQKVGRLMRAAPGKADAVVYDFVDDVGVLRNQFRERKRVYRELGMLG